MYNTGKPFFPGVPDVPYRQKVETQNQKLLKFENGITVSVNKNETKRDSFVSRLN